MIVVRGTCIIIYNMTKLIYDYKNHAMYIVMRQVSICVYRN